MTKDQELLQIRSQKTSKGFRNRSDSRVKPESEVKFLTLTSKSGKSKSWGFRFVPESKWNRNYVGKNIMAVMFREKCSGVRCKSQILNPTPESRIGVWVNIFGWLLDHGSYGNKQKSTITTQISKLKWLWSQGLDLELELELNVQPDSGVNGRSWS